MGRILGLPSAFWLQGLDLYSFGADVVECKQAFHRLSIEGQVDQQP